MNYEKLYKEALERATDAHKDTDRHLKATIERIFPELRESEDKKIRKDIVAAVETYGFTQDRKEEIYTWLEKQGEQKCGGDVNDEALQKQLQIWFDKGKCSGIDEVRNNPEKYGLQKPTDKVEPKFKVGDWITNGEYTWKVTDIKPLDYILQSQIGDIVGDTISYVDEEFHLWTIQDAKDGDVLVVGDEDGTGIAICGKTICGKNDKLGNNILYCCYDDENGFVINTTIALIDLLHPATKEHRDLLFTKMKETGYEWDAKKKELKKIEQRIVNNIPRDFEKYVEHLLSLSDGEGHGSPAKVKEVSAELFKLAKLEQKPAWCENDESMLTRCIGILGKCYMGELPTKVEEELMWLKSIKSKIQPNKEWSEGNEESCKLSP